MRQFIKLASILALLLTFVGCGGGGGGGSSTTAAGKVTFSGQVNDNTGAGAAVAGAPIGEVTVSAGGKTTTSDNNGFYQLKDVTIPATGRLVVTFEKNGYGTYQRTLPVTANKSYNVSAILASFDVSELDQDPTVQNTLAGIDPVTLQKKLELVIPANSLVDAAGNPVTGSVDVSMVLGDPSDAKGRAIFPGDYMAAPKAGGAPTTVLESVSFAEITVKDDAGNEVKKFDSANPATLRLKLPDMFQTGGSSAGTYVVGSTIEWWSYDETTGAWLEEDADPSTPAKDKAVVVDDAGILYAEGKVTHFSWWNADKPVDQHACICGTVVDENDAPMAGIQISATGVSYNGSSYPAQTDAQGKACVTVKRSTAETTETVKFHAIVGTFPYLYDITSAAEGDVATDILNVWTTAGSTINTKTGTCYNLTNNIRVAFDGTVNGTITYEDSGTPVPGIQVFTNVGSSGTSDAQGQYTLDVPLNQTIVLFVPGQESKTVVVTDAGTPGVVDFQIPNRAPVISSVTRNPVADPVNPSSVVAFTVNATDLDSDTLTYAWSADGGTPATGSSKNFSWTAPATAGTYAITVTVSDGKGGLASDTLNVVVGGSTGGTTLKVTTLQRTSTGDQPVPGVTVVLHGLAGNSEMTTDANGVADFGDVGLTRVTFSIGFQNDFTTWSERRIETLVNVLAGDVVYYTTTGDEDFSCANADTININGAFDPLAALTHVSLQPFSEAFGSVTGADTYAFANVPVCPENVQTDQNISMLVLGSTLDTNFNTMLTKYGFSLDNTFANGSNFNIDLSANPVAVTWSSSGPVMDLSLSANRKGVDFENLGGYFDYQTPATNGTFQAPGSFPADYWELYGTWFNQQPQQGGESRRFAWRRYDSGATPGPLPVSLSLTMPDYVFSTFAFAPTTGTYTWDLTGTANRDVLMLHSHNTMNDPVTQRTIETNWTMVMAPTGSSFTMPTLPANLAAWVDTATAYHLIQAIDFNTISGFDSLYSFFVLGNDPETAASAMMVGEQMFFPGTTIAKAAVLKKAAAEAPNAKDPFKMFKGLSRR